VAVREDRLFYAGAGPLAALLLGAALTPLRGLTPASNLAFAFMALTIVVAELGGRGAALATALVSALSLDFFLTEPYLRLAIEDKHDVIAFVGLGVCGLIAAALGSQRSRRVEALAGVARHRDLLRRLLRDWDESLPVEPQLTRVLAELPAAFPLAGSVIRDSQDRVLACARPSDAQRPIPQQRLEPESLLPAVSGSSASPAWDLAIAPEGGRLALGRARGTIGWLDLWGDGTPADAEARRALSDLARLLAIALGAAAHAREVSA
jgi:hypothetical protein